MSTTKFISFKVGDPTLGVTLYRSDNFNPSTGEFDGDKIEVQSTPAPIAFPLQSVVNGKKILQDVEGKMVYQGKFKTLAWDDVNGERITTAYHPNFHSFDLDYQKSKGKSVSKDDLDNSIVEINTGTVSFKKDSQMGKFLLDFTSFNGSNKARNPETKVLFENFDPIEETNIIMDIEQRKFDAMKFVMDAKNNEGRVFNLGAVFGLHNHNNDTSSIVSSLILKAKSETELFLKVIEEYKSSIDNMLKSAQSYEIIRFIDKKGQIEMLSESNQYVLAYSSDDAKDTFAKLIKKIASDPFDEINAEFLKKVTNRVNNYTKQ